jgi:hypothetical protein
VHPARLSKASKRAFQPFFGKTWSTMPSRIKSALNPYIFIIKKPVNATACHALISKRKAKPSTQARQAKNSRQSFALVTCTKKAKKTQRMPG